MYCAIRNFNEYDFSGDLESIGEFIHPYFKTDLLEKLEMTKDTDKQFVFTYCGEFAEDLSDMNNLAEARKNIKIMITDDFNIVPPNELKLPYFYAPFIAFADSLDKMKVLCEMGVSDVYISGELGFNLKEARFLADKFGIKLRVVPNIAQISGFGGAITPGDENLTAFWIRPDDLELYEEYIDVVEFSCIDNKQSVFFNVYFQEKAWRGNLNVLIHGIIDLENVGLVSAFTEARLNCKKKCILDRCHSCHRLAIAAKTIVENELELESI